MYFHKCCHCCSTKQWMWFARFCHFTFSKSSGHGFPCAVIAHLISSGWIFILCHCCFTWQCMWSSTSFHCSLSKSSGCSFPCVITTLLIRMGWICTCLSYCFAKHCMLFPSIVTALFQKEVDAVFHMFSLPFFNKQRM